MPLDDWSPDLEREDGRCRCAEESARSELLMGDCLRGKGRPIYFWLTGLVRPHPRRVILDRIPHHNTT